MNKLFLLAASAGAASAACDPIAVATCSAAAAMPTDLTQMCDYYQELVTCSSKNGCMTDEACDLIRTQATAAGFECTITCSTGCFPASAELVLADKSTKKMGDLSEGDKVHVGKGQYSDVYLFTTKEVDNMSKFAELTTKSSSILLTAQHYLYVNGALAQAGTVKVGDKLTLADGSEDTVTEVGEKWEAGLYNPHTQDGDIVVNGFLTSTYTGEVNPSLAHALLMPVRQMYAAGATFGQGFSAMAKSVPSWIRQAIL